MPRDRSPRARALGLVAYDERMRRGMSQAQFADASMTHSAVMRVESGVAILDVAQLI